MVSTHRVEHTMSADSAAILDEMPKATFYCLKCKGGEDGKFKVPLSQCEQTVSATKFGPHAVCKAVHAKCGRKCTTFPPAGSKPVEEKAKNAAQEPSK